MVLPKAIEEQPPPNEQHSLLPQLRTGYSYADPLLSLLKPMPRPAPPPAPRPQGAG